MSRLAAYLGPNISLSDFLLTPEQGLYQQSLSPSSLQYARPSADGFGFGWYYKHAPQRYIRECPIWHDHNLGTLAATMHSPLWLANVHNAGDSQAEISLMNTQPFHDNLLLFMHHGFVENFSKNLKLACHEYLSNVIAAEMRGNSEAEYLFAMLRQRMQDPDHIGIEAALQDILSTLEISLRDISSMLNIIVSDGDKIYAARHATNRECPPLYYTTDDSRFPGGKLVATEPLTDSDNWQMIPEHHLLVLDNNNSVRITRL